MTKRGLAIIALGATFLAGAALAGASMTTQPQPNPGGQQGFPDLVGGLSATPGCLGVETARTSSGKNVIFAWFEDKEAVLRWHYSDMHRGVIEAFFPERGEREPLAGVPDDMGPIMAIASITMPDQPQFEETSL